MNLEWLSASDRVQAARWDALVSGSSFPDIYYRPGYVRAYEVEGHGRAVALHLATPGAGFLFPALLRPLSGLSFFPHASGEDAITAYGYGGILSLDSRRPTTEELRAALDAVHDWCKRHRIVSWLFRLHPLLSQAEWMEPLADSPDGILLRHFGPTTAMSLSDWSESRLRTRWRSYLSSARRSLRVTWSSSSGASLDAPAVPEALRIFRTLYEETMDRLGAAPLYHFSSPYYAALADGLGSRLAVALAWKGDEAVAGVVFFADQECAHYHLSGANEAGRAARATMLLICDGIAWARARGCSRLHLGGGVSGADSLFEFKKGFGGETYQYAFAGLIADPSRYDDLLAARRQTGQAIRPDFFPAYRA